jgi:serine/threonine protein kinase
VALPPDTLIAGTYEILGPLGKGGMGELFRARNTRTERKVALKLLRPDAKARGDAIERFRREAKAAGMINSDHVTQVLDIQDDPVHGIAIVFELLEGENLLDYLRRTGVMSLEAIHPMVEQILRGLQDAHAVGIIHRDLKPSNVFLEKRPDGGTRIKILDFGISKLPKTMAKNTLTEPGQTLGSFMFMPPEQIQRAASVDQRADVYAIGTLVFQAMTGQLPYNARSMAELVQLKNNSEPRTLQQVSNKPFPPQLQAWIDRCLKRNPSERFQSAAEAAAAWRALLSTAPPPASYLPSSPFATPTPQFPAPPPSSPAPSSGGHGAPPSPHGYSAPYPPPLHQAPIPDAYEAPTQVYQQMAPPARDQAPPLVYTYPPQQPAPPQSPAYAPPQAPLVVAPSMAAPVAPQRQGTPPWLLVVAVVLVVAAGGVLAVVGYTLLTR